MKGILEITSILLLNELNGVIAHYMIAATCGVISNIIPRIFALAQSHIVLHTLSHKSLNIYLHKPEDSVVR